jgi:hypothetical protein
MWFYQISVKNIGIDRKYILISQNMPISKEDEHDRTFDVINIKLKRGELSEYVQNVESIKIKMIQSETDIASPIESYFKQVGMM